MKKFKKLLGSTEDPHFRQKFKDAIHLLSEVDLMYTQYTPRLEPYAPIWPKQKETDGNKEVQSKDPASQVATHSHSDGCATGAIFEDRQCRPPKWFLIEQAMQEGTAALEQIRDRQDVAAFHSRPPTVLGTSRQRHVGAKNERQIHDEDFLAGSVA